jgi:pilus assembly protein CpaE
VLLDSFMSHSDGIALLPGPKAFWTERPGTTQHAPSVESLGHMLDIVARNYRYAMVDLNSSLDKPQMEVVIKRATSVVVVLTPELPALWRTQSLFEFLKDCGGKDKVRIVVNRCRRTDQITAAEIEKTLKHPVFWKLPNDYNASIEAINSGKPLVSLNHVDLSHSYRMLAHRLAEIELPTKRSRILRMLSIKRRRRLNA